MKSATAGGSGSATSRTSNRRAEGRMAITEDSSKRPLWYSLAALAAILPAMGTALAVRGVIKVFEGMARTGSGGVGTVAIGLYEANWPLIIAAALAAVL